MLHGIVTGLLCLLLAGLVVWVSWTVLRMGVGIGAAALDEARRTPEERERARRDLEAAAALAGDVARLPLGEAREEARALIAEGRWLRGSPADDPPASVDLGPHNRAFFSEWAAVWSDGLRIEPGGPLVGAGEGMELLCRPGADEVEVVWEGSRPGDAENQRFPTLWQVAVWAGRDARLGG